MQVTLEQTKRGAVSGISSENKYSDVAFKQRIVKTSYNSMDIFYHQPDSDENFLGVKSFQDQGKTMDEIQLLASVMDMDTLQDKMVMMSNSVSEEDLGRMFEEGFHAGSTKVDEYVSIVDRIKLTEAKSGKVIAGYNDNLASDMIENAVGDTALAAVIKNTLEKSGYSINDDMMKKLDSTVQMCKELEPMNDSTKKYLVENQLEPSIKNLFEAQFSGSISGKKLQTQFMLDETGYVQKCLLPKEGNVTNQELEAVLAQNGIEPTKENVQNALWMNQEGIDITQRNMKYAEILSSLSLPLSDEELLLKITQAFMDGINPEDTDLSRQESMVLEAKQISERFDKVSEEGLKVVIKENLPFTLQTLEMLERSEEYQEPKDYQESKEDQESKEYILDDRQTTALISAKRQLEEARAYMTARSGYTLLKVGVSIDTTEISKLVETLKYLENRTAKELFPNETEEKAVSMEKTFSESVKAIHEMQGMPLSMVGVAITKRDSICLQDYYEEGQREAIRMEMAKKSYETYMTVIRTDLGDSIEHAFSNMNEMLQEAEIEATDENIRAAKILGYNHLEITEENLEIVKEADEKLKYVLNELNPAMVLQMIREGKKPMELKMESLLEEIEAYRGSPETEHMRFSKFLYGLDQKKEISGEERKAFLDVYRVLKQVEKKNGAPLGALLVTGAEFTLENLKKASRSSKKEMDYTISNGKIDTQKYAREVRSVSYKLSVSAIEKAMEQKEAFGDITLEDLKKAIQETDDQKETMDFVKKEQELIKEAAFVKEETVKLGDLYELPQTAEFLVALEDLKENRGNLYRTLTKALSSKDEEAREVAKKDLDLSADFLKEIEDFKEDLSAETPLEETYHNFLENVQESLIKSMEEADGYIDLKQMMTCMKQVGILKTMEKKKEYEIPMFVKGELTSVHVTINRESGQKGNVSITTQLISGDKIGGCFYENDSKVSGYIAVTSDDSEKEMSQMLERMKEQLKERNLQYQKVEIVRSKELDLNKIDQRKVANQDTSTENLYHIAKAFLTSI